jgi:hypothetical protein
LLSGIIIVFALYSIHRKITTAGGSSSSLSFSESRPTKVQVDHMSDNQIQ